MSKSKKEQEMPKNGTADEIISKALESIDQNLQFLSRYFDEQDVFRHIVKKLQRLSDEINGKSPYEQSRLLHETLAGIYVEIGECFRRNND